MPLSLMHPALLAGAACAVVPLAAHLLGGRRRQRVPFAPVAWLVPLGEHVAAPRRLAHRLLLLLRMALLVLVAVCVARPYQPTAPEAGAVGAVDPAWVLVLDRSASMGYLQNGGTLLAHAREEAHAAVRRLAPQQPVGLVVVPGDGGPPSTPVTRAHAAVHAAIDAVQLQPVGANAEMGPAILRAEAMAAAAGPHGHVLVLGDLSRHGYGTPLPPPAVDRGGATVAWFDAAGRARSGIEAPPALSNVGLESLAIGGGAPAGAPGVALVVRLHNFGEAPVRGRGLSLSLAGRVVQRGFVDLAARAALDKVFVVARPPTSSFVAEARLDAAADDGYVADDSASATLAVAPPVRLWAVDGADGGAHLHHRGELFFAERALAQVPRELGVTTVTLVPRAGMAQALATAQAAKDLPMDVLLLANVGDLSVAEGQAVAALSGRQVGLVVALGDRVRVDEGAAAWAQALPFTLRDVYTAEAPVTGGAALGEPLVQMQEDHPIIAPLGATALAGLRASHTRRYMHVAPLAGVHTQVVMAFATGAPALLVAPATAARGPVLLWATSLDVGWSDVPLAGAFVPWLQQVVRYGSRGDGHMATPAAPLAAPLNPLAESDFIAVAPAALAVGAGPNVTGRAVADYQGATGRAADAGLPPTAALTAAIALAAVGEALLAALRPGAYLRRRRAVGAGR